MKALGLLAGALLVGSAGLFAASRSGSGGKASRGPLPGIVSNALAELSKWSGLTETMAQGLQLVKGYWEGAKQGFLSINDPWSAVFVSDMANRAAPGSLKRAQAHFDYAADAYRNRGVKGKYGAYRPTEIEKLLPSDIVIRGRSGVRTTFEDLARSGDFKPTHGDIVTDVGQGYAQAVGGNVNNAVSQTSFAVNNGRVADPEIFAVLRYQA